MAFLLTFAGPIVVNAQQHAGVSIGCFCLDGVRGQRHPNEANTVVEGTWIPWTFTYVKTPRGSPARLFVFDRPIASSTALLSCDETASAARAAGARLLVAGTLNKLTLHARVFNANNGQNRFQVDAGGLDAELGHVTSGEHLIGGATVQLAGAVLYITNPERLVSQATKMTGTVQIEAWNRTLVGAKLVLPGGSALTATLLPIDPDRENVTFRVDTDTGVATLWQGHLQGTPAQAIVGPTLTVGGVALADADVAVQRVVVIADSGHLTCSLADASGSAASATLARSSVTTAFLKPKVKWKQGDGAVEQTPETFTVSALSLAEAQFQSLGAEVRTSTNVVAISGAADARFTRLTSTAAVGSAHWTHPDVPALPFVLPAGAVNSFDIDFAGDLDNPHFRGTAAAAQFALGPISIARELAIPFDVTGGASELRVPLRFAIPPVGAGITIRDPDQTAVITATLQQANVDGTIVITWPELRQSHIDIPANQLRMRLTNTVATKPLLAGVAPGFGTASVGMANSTPIRAAEHSSGMLKLELDVLILGQPILRIGDKSHESPSTLKLTAEGTAAVRYDLERGKMALLRGAFKAHDVEFALLDPNGTLDLGGTVLSAPRVHFEELAIDVDEEQNPPKSEALLTKLSVNANRATRPGSAEHPKEVTWDAVPTRAFSIDAVSAQKTSISDAVEMKQITVRGLDFAMHDAAARFGDGFTVSQATLALTARSIASIDDGTTPTTYSFDDATFSVNGRLSTMGQVHINGDTGFELSLTVSGRSERLSGTGTAKLGGFTGSDVTTLPITTVCTLNLPVEFNFAVGGADLQVQAVNGEFVGDANLAPIALVLHSSSGASCNTPSEEYLISDEKKIGPITIPKVAIKYHKRFHIDVLAGTALLTNPRAHLGGGNLQVCNLGMISVGPPAGLTLAGAAVAPEIETAVPGADTIINGLINIPFEVIESTVATVVTNGAGFLVSTLATPAGNVLCLRP